MATATKKAAPSTLVREFSVKKSTPNTIAFQEDEPADGSRPAIGTIYVTKAALTGLGDTKRIRVTVEAAD